MKKIYTIKVKDKILNQNHLIWAFIKPFAVYSGAALLSLLLITWVLKLWQADLNVPFDYYVDSISVQAMIKGIVENGWYLNNPNLGAPTGYSLLDYPNADNFQILIIKFISIFIHNSGSIINTYFIFTYPLITLTTLYTLRKLDFSYLAAFTASILYVFMPFHLFRGQGHLFLGAYYIVPLVFLVIYWSYAGEINLLSKTSIKMKLKDRKILVSLVILVILGQSGLYYAFFGGLFIGIMGILTSLQKREIVHLKNSVLLSLIVFMVVILGMVPNLTYKIRHGANPLSAVRQSAEAEIYGLKISQLVFPITYHRIPALAKFKKNYNDTTPYFNENQDSTLGLIGSIGFFVLLGWMLLRDRSVFKFFGENQKNLQDCLGTVNLIALLLGTVGGFGSIIAYSVTPQIRAYNRICIFIAFFSITTMFLILDSLYKKYAKSIKTKMLFYVFFVAILVVGIFDQTYVVVPTYKNTKTEYMSEQNFINNVEKSVPKKSMIFQLPYVAFPESAPVNKLLDYNLFRAYLHSKNLRWSYGAVKGRQGDAWQKQVSAKPTKQFIKEISKMGFNGIYIDRFGYADNARSLEKEISIILKIKPIVSQNNRQLFFSLLRHEKK